MNVTSGNIAMNGFTGHEKDFESRYVTMGVRQYDPKLGRFLSVDPLFDMFPDQNPYHYCYNSPLIYSDPSGMAPETVYEIVEEDGLTYQYMYELVRDGDIESMNPQYKKFISKHNVGGGRGKGYDPTKDIYNKYNEYKEGSQGRDISARGGGWKGTGDNSGGSGARQESLEDWLTKNRNFSGLISNLNQLSESQQTAVNEALQIIYDNGGRDVIDYLSSNNGHFKINFVFTAFQLRDRWNEFCKKIKSPIAGITANLWPNVCKEDGAMSCNNPNFEVGVIYLAVELIDGKVIDKNTYDYYEPGWLFGWFGSWERAQKELWMVFAHEIKHRYDSFNCNGPFDREESANRFMIDIWNNYKKPWKYKE